MRNLAILATSAAIACSHGSPNNLAMQDHDASGCLAACPGASVVETSPDGDKCRCWSHKVGMQYTFAFPDSEEKLAYAKRRWQHAVGIAQGCKLQGMGWESTPDGSDMQCVRYQGPPADELLKRIASGQYVPRPKGSPSGDRIAWPLGL